MRDDMTLAEIARAETLAVYGLRSPAVVDERSARRIIDLEAHIVEQNTALAKQNAIIADLRHQLGQKFGAQPMPRRTA